MKVIIKLIALVLVTLTISSNRGLADEDKKKLNVLFIAVDDLRPELGCYDHRWIKSPSIDKLAASGTIFNRAYCQVAVCGASRASLMTGLRPNNKRFLNYKTYTEKDAPGAMTLAEEFKKNGYHCISNGKIFHHKTDTADRSWSESPWRPSMGGGNFIHPDSKNMIGGRKNRGPVFEAPDVKDNAYPDGQIADKTISDLKRMKKTGKPFFLACGFMKPHLPFYAPKKYWDLYDHKKISVADNQNPPKNAPRSLKGSGEIHSYHNRNIKYNSDEWHRSCRHGYYACVSYIDAQVGKVLKTLDELELRENTIVILWGDHGWHLGEHNFWGKHNVMHLATRSPMIISAPGFKTKQSCDRLVEFVDIYPSLCELVGISSVNKNLQGRSFLPLMKNPNRAWKKAAFSKFGPAVSIITDRYNYAEFKNGEKMLYDLKNDASENSNLAGVNKHNAVVTQLSQMLADGWESALPEGETTTLKQAFKDDFLIGAAIKAPLFLENPKSTLNMVSDQFNSVSSCNMLKWAPFNPKPGVYRHEAADAYVEFGNKNNMYVVGHVLFWHNQTPKWVYQDKAGKPLVRADLLKRMRERVNYLSTRYGKKIDAWDTVNEAIMGNGKMRESDYLKILGKTWIEHAFRIADDELPQSTKLFYNDYSMTGKGKRNAVVKMIHELKQKKIRIDGVGMQAHWKLDTPSIADIEASIVAFSKAGVEVHITELDIDVLPKNGADPYQNGLPDEIQKKLAKRYSEIFSLFLKHKDKIERVTFWGTTDKYSWKNNHPVKGRTNYPLLFDRDGKQKPAYQAVVELKK